MIVTQSTTETDLLTETLGPLVDSFGRRQHYLRIAVTDRCNLRCRYCMPAEGIEWRERDEILRFEEIVRLTKIFAQLGVTKVRLTGGEPLVRKDIDQLIAALRKIDGIRSLGLTTNGVRLASMVQPLKNAGLNHLNVSLDSLKPERFEKIALRDHFANVMAGIHAAMQAPFDSLKINVVVMGGVNDDELLDFVRFVKDKPVQVRFIEFMPFSGNQWDQASVVSFAQMKKTIGREFQLAPLSNQWEPDHVAKEFYIDGFAGTVGFITSMTEHFCDGCSRVRLTADGSIKSCLHHPAEINLRNAIRAGVDDEELAGRIRRAVRDKPRGHAPAEELVLLRNRTMIQIGG